MIMTMVMIMIMMMMTMMWMIRTMMVLNMEMKNYAADDNDDEGDDVIFARTIFLKMMDPIC